MLCSYSTSEIVMNRSRVSTTDRVTVFKGTQELSMRLTDVNSSRLSPTHESSRYTSGTCTSGDLEKRILQILFLLQVDVVYLERDDGEKPAVFPQNGGQFE